MFDGRLTGGARFSVPDVVSAPRAKPPHGRRISILEKKC
jgi:hypothetical protein